MPDVHAAHFAAERARHAHELRPGADDHQRLPFSLGHAPMVAEGALMAPYADVANPLPGRLIHLNTLSPRRREIRRMAQQRIAELTLKIAERANRLAAGQPLPPGGELALWLEAEAQVKRELKVQVLKDFEPRALRA
jgi:hypothetical protein